jgi:hypothetical protein
MNSIHNSLLIAPCGMNCGVCMAYLRVKNHCSGCRGSLEGKSKSVLACKIKNCDVLNSDFCYTCNQFPCKRIKHIDKRYRTKYHMSMIENLQNIQKLGIDRFTKNETPRWTCPICQGTICVHRSCCPNCGNKLPD